MTGLLALLPHKPWRVLAGNLSLLQLGAVIQHSALHCCGDTGTLHMALMTGTPTVSWFRPNPGTEEWIPIGAHHRAVMGTGNDRHAALQGIASADVVKAVEEVMKRD